MASLEGLPTVGFPKQESQSCSIGMRLLCHYCRFHEGAEERARTELNWTTKDDWHANS